MKVSELKNKLNLEILTSPDFTDREVRGCYIGDLLSWVMGRAKAGNAWITIMNNINIVAVAELTEISCIILCEGVTAEEDIIKKSDAEDIIIFQSPRTAFELACELSGDLI